MTPTAPVAPISAHDRFDFWASIGIPAIGIVVSVLIPIAVIYMQRHIDYRRMTEEQRVSARKSGLRRVEAELAPFVGMDLTEPGLDLHSHIVRLRLACMWLIDEYPSDHPIGRLVTSYYVMGILMQDSIQAHASGLRRASVSADERVSAHSPLHKWAAEFTTDLRVIYGGQDDESAIGKQADDVQKALESYCERIGREVPLTNLARTSR